MSEVFTFEPESHVYTLNGNRLPSVTGILDDVGIVNYGGLPEDTRSAALERGRAVHQAIYLDLQDDLDDTSVPEAYLPYLEAFRAFRQDTGFRPRTLEHRMHHATYLYAGTLDAEGSITYEGRREDWLLDFKTGTAESWVRMQLAAYAAMMPDPAARLRCCVELRKNGRYKVYPFSPAEYYEDFSDFLCALRIYVLKRRSRRL